jgi:GTP pyrophosphokinase
VHTGLGHRCRGAKINGAIVPLDRALANGDRVEIIAARAQEAGPSRDWLNPALGYIASSRARNKVRQWFNAIDLERTIAEGRAIVEKELQREGATGLSHAQVAASLGFASAEELYTAAGRDEVGHRQLQVAIRGEPEKNTLPPAPLAPDATRTGSRPPGGILVVGVDRLMTQLARCCKPVPPDDITGFVTRGRGVSIHRSGCASLARLRERHPERLLDAQWGKNATGSASVSSYPVDIAVHARERIDLLRDVSEILAREQIRVSGLQSYAREGSATLMMTLEVQSLAHLKRTLPLIESVAGVLSARRR